MMLKPEPGRRDRERHPSRSAVFATPPQAGLRQLRDEVERAARVQRSLLPDVSLPVGEFRLASL